VADAVRSILDGHIVMERAIAERGRYPAINILKSVSRTMPGCVPDHARATVLRARALLSSFGDMEELIRLGAYRRGSDSQVDEAIRLNPALEAFLAQAKGEATSLEDGYAALARIVDETPDA
jgi:flagellum-specific ATP synthase